MVNAVNPTPGAQPVTTRTATQDTGAAPLAAGTDTLSATPETVRVDQGDTLGAIAARYGVSIAQLEQLNPELFKNGTDASGRQRSADGHWIYKGDVVRLRPAAQAAPATPAQTAVASDRVVAAAKAFIDAAAQTKDGGTIAEAQNMLALIPAHDAERAAYEAKIRALAGRAQVSAPASDGAADLQAASEAFNDASRAYDQAQDPAAKAAARTQALIAYQRAAAIVNGQPAGDAKDMGKAQLEMLEMRLRGMGASDAALDTARTAAGLPPAPVARPIDPAAQEAFAAAQAKFDEASEAYDKARQSAKTLAEAAAGIAAAHDKAMAAYSEALATGARVGPAAQPALDAMAQRLRQMGISQAAIDRAKAAAPPMSDGMGGEPPNAGGPTNPPGTPLPVGPLTQNPAATPQPQTAPTPQAITDQFAMQRQLFQKAIEDYVNASTNGDQVGAENARARAKAAYAEAAKLVGQMDDNTKRSYSRLLDEFEDKLQFYRVATIPEMDPIRKAAKLAPSASTAWAPDNRKDGAPIPEVSKTLKAQEAAQKPPVTPQATDEPKNDEEKKIREQLAQSLPRMNAGQIAKMPYDAVKAASSDQRGFMLKELLDHWWVGGDKKKYAADIIEIASGEGKLDQTLRDFDRHKKGGGLGLLFKKLKGDDRSRTVKNIFWDLKDTNRVHPDVLIAVSGHMKKDDVRTVLAAYGHGPESAWFKRVPPEVKATWAKTLNSGWFGKSAQDGALIQALQPGTK